ncbi:MAG: hypothetical protein C5B51_27795 [Terriglobia bacterium]|nr:MAG: hypothetical protein C5B51_27795 [Terriglobia bacterium]
MTQRIGASLALGLLLTAAAWAHHNMTALFDLNDRVTLNGTFTKLDWRNPHIYLSVEVKTPNGQVETWDIEGPPPSFFRTRDITKADFESALGKPVTAEASRARDHSLSGLIRTITLPGGKVVSACPQNC